MAERQPRVQTLEREVEKNEEKNFDPRAVRAFEFLTDKKDYSGMSYDEIMATDENLHGMRTVERRRGNAKSQNTLYLADLLVGSRYSDSEYFNKVVDTVANLPSDQKPDEIVMTGLYMGDFGGRKKNSRWMLKQGLRTLDQQFRAGKEKLDQLHELGIPVVYTRSDNDTDVIEEMTHSAFNDMRILARQHMKDSEEPINQKRQLSVREKNKAHPQWMEYYNFTKYVAFPYCMRTGRALRDASEVSAATNGACDEPEREVLFDAYRRISNGQRLLPKHRELLDVSALKDGKGLTIVGDMEHHITTRGQEYTDLIRHKFQTSNQPLSNYFRKMNQIRGSMAAEGADEYDNYIITGQSEAAGVFRPDGKAVHSIGGFQDPRKALKEDGDSLMSPANTVAKAVHGRGRFHEPNATSIERKDDGRHIITFYNKKLMEVSESIPERTMVMLQCDWQAGNLAARPDYQIMQLDFVNRRMSEMAVVLALGGDMVEGRNYFDFNRESGRTGLGAMDQQFHFVKMMIERSFRDVSTAQLRNMIVKQTIGNHEWNSGTLKVNGYSFADALIDEYRMAYLEKGFTRDEANERVQFQDTIVTDRGEPVKTYSTLFKVGEMGFELRHFFGAGKGTGGQPPAFAGHNQTVGLGDTRENVHVGIFGHYHHPNYLLGGNKLYVGAGSLNGMTGFEYEKNLRATNAVVALHIGGGLPPQLEIINENALINHKISDGPFSDKVIREELGFRNDQGANPLYSPYLEQTPKTAKQKLVLELGRQASYSRGRTGAFSPEKFEDTRVV